MSAVLGKVTAMGSTLRGTTGSAAAPALVALAIVLAGCGTGDTNVGTEATRACAPLVKFQADAVALLNGQPGDKPSANRVTAALGLAAAADRLLPVADALDRVGSRAKVKTDEQASQVTAIVTAELALRRVAADLREYKFALATFASDDVESAGKLTGGACRAPLGDGTGKQLRALPTTPQ